MLILITADGELHIECHLDDRQTKQTVSTPKNEAMLREELLEKWPDGELSGLPDD